MLHLSYGVEAKHPRRIQKTVALKAKSSVITVMIVMMRTTNSNNNINSTTKNDHDDDNKDNPLLIEVWT